MDRRPLMKSRTFKSARVAALASMLFAQGPLIVSARTAPAPSSDGFGAFIDKFWPEIWGTPFHQQQSGSLLSEIAPGVFGVRVIDGPDVVAAGTYFEVLRLDEPQLGGWPELGGVSDQLQFDHAVTA